MSKICDTNIHYDIDMVPEKDFDENVDNSKLTVKINMIIGDYRLLKTRKEIFKTIYVWKCIRRYEKESESKPTRPSDILNNKLDAN